MSTMIATRSVFPIGYSTSGSQERIDELMSNPQMLLIDTRISPKSWNAVWCKDALQERYGNRYRCAGQFLGNKALGTGGIEIANPSVGIKGLVKYLNEGHDLILLCQCRQYEQCHVSSIVGLLRQKADIDVVRFGQEKSTDTLKCLSIKQPWAWLIANGLKDIENRDWTTNHRGPLLIHAGKAVDKDCFVGDQINFDFFEQFGSEVVDAMPRHKRDYALGCIIGQADLVGVVEDSSNQWFCGTYGFVLENAQASTNPIIYTGKLKLFDVSQSVIVQNGWQSQPESQEEALPSETEQLSTGISMPFVVSVDRSIGHCVICLDAGMMVPATIVSSSGREDSVYCETHGHCKRCGTSVEAFVPHPYITNYVCPCVIALLMDIESKEELKKAKPVAFGF